MHIHLKLSSNIQLLRPFFINTLSCTIQHSPTTREDFFRYSQCRLRNQPSSPKTRQSYLFKRERALRQPPSPFQTNEIFQISLVLRSSSPFGRTTKSSTSTSLERFKTFLSRCQQQGGFSGTAIDRLSGTGPMFQTIFPEPGRRRRRRRRRRRIFPNFSRWGIP